MLLQNFADILEERPFRYCIFCCFVVLLLNFFRGVDLGLGCDFRLFFFNLLKGFLYINLLRSRFIDFEFATIFQHDLSIIRHREYIL